MIPLIVRHIKLFIRDKASVFFSILSVLIIILLYVLFLGESISSSLPKFKERDLFTFLWMFAGLLAVTTVTTPLGALGKSIEDKSSKRDEDLLMTRIHRRTLVYSYIWYSFFIGCMLTILLFVFGYIYIYIAFNVKLAVSFSFVGVIFLSIFMHTWIFYLLVSYLRTMGAFSGFSTIIGTLIGFLAGIYVPIGILPPYIQKVMILFPTTQTTVLLRNLLLADTLDSIKVLFPSESYDQMLETLGIQIRWDEKLLSPTFSWTYLLGFTFVLICLVFIQNRSK